MGKTTHRSTVDPDALLAKQSNARRDIEKVAAVFGLHVIA